MKSDPFYCHVLKLLLESKKLSNADRVLVVCGGGLDHASFLDAGFTNVTISNLDDRMLDEGGERFAPYEWAYTDAEKIDFPDGDFDIVAVHSGLHHCYSPIGALVEMCRVAKKGILFFEPHDTWFTRLGVRLGFGQDYEHAAVFGNDMTHGGVANTEIPNFVYRFSKHELEKTFACLEPTVVPDMSFFYALRVPGRLESLSNPIWSITTKVIKPLLTLLAKAFPFLCNNFACYVSKSTVGNELHPWLVWKDGTIRVDKGWLLEKYSGNRGEVTAQR